MPQDGNVPVKSARRNTLVSELEAIEAQLERKYNTREASNEKMSITTSTDDKEARPTFEAAEESREAEEESSKTTSPGETDLFAALDIDSVSQVFSGYASEEQKLALMCLIGVPSFAVFAIVNELYHDAVDPMADGHERPQCENAGENYYYSSRLGDRPKLARRRPE